MPASQSENVQAANFFIGCSDERGGEVHRWEVRVFMELGEKKHLRTKDKSLYIAPTLKKMTN